MKRFLAGDIGGTKVIMALYEVEGDQITQTAEKRYVSAEHATFTEILVDFRKEHDAPVAATGLGVAGPVFDRRCQATNLPWVIDARELEASQPVGRVALVNDFKAAALGVLHLKPGEWVDLNPGTTQPHGPIAVLGAGTGLGQALLFYSDKRYHVVPTEGGHKDFAPRTDDEIGLLKFLRERHGRVSYERVLSGAGLHAVYDYVVTTRTSPELAEVRDAMAKEDAAAVISQWGQSGKDPNCVKALDIFATVYGAEAGNLALQIVATGGVYLTGGIGPKNVGKLLDGSFLKGYLTKGRFSKMVADIPCKLVTNKNVGLLGAAAAAMELEQL
ncbi:MAG: glucokinase [Cyanobacteria bacterium RYN_339]|nr:glucokinase [Cyanobacteria bacterium RYN_339]